ncbi:MAG TPA: sialidase family protein [Verrucomicrobiota bacterium]|nr:sialidase family protein [Verrucomicrobiota bacterium]
MKKKGNLLILLGNILFLAVFSCVGWAWDKELKDSPLNGEFTTHIAYSDGKHNAFTGAAVWNDSVFIVFRHAEHHVSFDGQVKIIASKDAKEFKEIATISASGKDLRDPKILNAGGILYIYTGAVDVKDNQRGGTEAKLYTSSDGKNWEEQRVTGLYPGSWLWFVHYDGKQFYGSAYCHNEGEGASRATLYKSKDGKNWESFFSIPVKASNEVALDTGNNGELFALVRQENSPNHPFFLKIEDPVNKPGIFELESLPFPLQGPFIKRMKRGNIVIGRRWDEGDGKENFFSNPRTERRVEMIWVGDNGKIQRLCTLPSGGDCSYPGWAQLADGKILVSYYSGHAGKYPKADIYVAVFEPGQLDSEHPLD